MIETTLVRDDVAQSIPPGSHNTTFGRSVFATRPAYTPLSRVFTGYSHPIAFHLNPCLFKLTSFFPTMVKERKGSRLEGIYLLWIIVFLES